MVKNSTVNLNDIPNLAMKIANSVKGGEIFGLVGPLGSGKTTFTQILAKNLKVSTKVTSPTFVIMNQHFGKTKKLKNFWFLHLDLYRIKSFNDIKTLGLTEIWGSPKTVTVIEWANKIKKHLPKKTRLLFFSGK